MVTEEQPRQDPISCRTYTTVKSTYSHGTGSTIFWDGKMIIFNNELPINHEQSLQHIVNAWALDMHDYDADMGLVKPNGLLLRGSWNAIEEQLSSEGLIMELEV